MEAEGKWNAQSKGGYFGHWWFAQLMRLGPGFAEAFLYPVVTFYTLVARKERAASQQYLERVLGPTHVLGNWLRAWRHLMAFARAYLDGAMLGARGPGLFTVERQGAENLRAVGESGKGAVMVTAHLGTWELSSGMIKDTHGISRVALVMFRSDAEALQRFIESMHGRRPRVITVGEGDLVAMQGDRTVDTRDVRVPFFGHDARWPVGPWIIAAISGAPILTTFALRTGKRRYTFIADPPRTVRFEPGRSKDDQLREWIAAYVARIEEVLRAHPYQWFNFFDFWSAEPKVPSAPPTPGLPG